MAATPGIGADAIDSEWLDKMVNKLKAELEAQLKRVASGERHKNDAAALAADARTLASLERTLERLAKLEQARALVRESKIRKQDKGARDALERRLDSLAAAAPEKKHS
jgi:hypothetical protein